MTMDEADKLVRAVTPLSGSFYKDGDKIVKIWSAKVDPNEGEIKLSDGYLTPIDYEIEDSMQKAIKRLIDIILSLIVLIVFLPIWIIVAI